ncbi:methyl-accepting chemotaxis protein [Algicola sagamiensis]|uniref:methyl-accepting chemotaxis protein n=1 Tax=Algicola sagamiensis TaxID=163869 RepID=UPI00036038DC|nr:methyl-accepting chemotaxis protein [Algicola sagamiensis]
MNLSQKLLSAFFATIVIPIVIILVIVIVQNRNQALDNFMSANVREARQIDFALNTFFDEIGKDACYLASHPFIQQMDETVQDYKNITGSVPLKSATAGGIEQKIYEVYRDFGITHKNIKYVYSGIKTNQYIQYPADAIAPPNPGETGYFPTKRAWFPLGMKVGHNPGRTEAYYYAPEKAFLISFVCGFKNGNGVQALDISLSNLEKTVAEVKIGEGGYLMLVEKSGKVLVDPRFSEHANNMIEEISGGKYKEIANMSEGIIHIDIDGEDFLANIYTSEKLGWKIIGLVSMDEVMAPANNLTYTIIVIGLILLGVFMAIAVFLSRRLTKPIAMVSTGLEDISKGGGDLSRRLTVSGNDETALLADSFNHFLGSISNLVTDIKQTANQVSRSAENAHDLTSSANESIQQQQMAMDMVATAITEMSATANEVAQTCAGAANSAQHTQQSTEKGQHQVDQMLSGMQTLGEMIQSAADNIVTLDSESENITSILDVIRGIAEQTNLLALNAAIEAARAGEQGRGFAVVADEVRALAQRAQEATQEITQQLEQLRSMTRSISGEMEKSLDQSERALNLSNEAKATFDSINSSIIDISDMNTQIAAAAEEQHQVSEDINKNMEQIRDASNDVAGIAGQVDETASELHDFSDTLNDLVGKFKT